MKTYRFEKYKDINRIMVAEGLEHLTPTHPELIECVTLKCPICHSTQDLDIQEFPEEGTIIQCENEEVEWIIGYKE